MGLVLRRIEVFVFLEGMPGGNVRARKTDEDPNWGKQIWHGPCCRLYEQGRDCYSARRSRSDVGKISQLCIGLVIVVIFLSVFENISSYEHFSAKS